MHAAAMPGATPFLDLGELSCATLEVWAGGWAPASVRRQQALGRLQALVKIARTQTPLYADLYRELPDDVVPALADLPPVTKHDLMRDVAASFTDRSIDHRELDAFIADSHRVGELFRGRYAVWTSSGTLGEPGVFLHDRRALAVYEALEALRFRGLASFADYGARVLTGERFALVMATGGHFASVASLEHLRQSFPWLSASVAAFSLMTPLPQLVAQLNAWRPTLLATYPTAAEVLAQEQEAGRLNVHLGELWTGGETLAPAVKARLAHTFECRVRNGYGASEFLSIAADCDHGALHVNADWVLLEPVDANGRPVPPGLPSHTTLLTNLANRAQPLIRYDLGDSITVLPPCACGSTLPAIRVEGRHDDVLRFQAAGESIDLPPLVLTTVLEEDAQVYDFQVTQTGASALHVALGDASSATRSRVRRVLAAWLVANGVRDVALCVESRAPQRDPGSGKLRRIVRASSAAQLR
jgi:phenylacetate-coenzyme A ligase PaaK-like adenylate-forming protein